MKPSSDIKRMSAKFGLRIKRMHIVQNGVYRVTSANGKTYCLKRMPYPPARLHWIDNTLLRIKRKGFHRIVWRNPKQRTGRRLYVRSERDDHPAFVLHPWVTGRWPKATSNAQMKRCGTFLAQFHTVGRKIQIPKKGRHIGLGTWPAYLRKERNKLRKLIQRAKRNGFRRPLDQLLQKNGSEVLRMANDSIRFIKRGNYRAVCRTAKPTLCHGDFGPTNIMRTKKGMVLLDFETLRVDLRSYDLYRLIFNTCQQTGWNFKTARSILDGYQQVSPLGRSDYAMLKAMLRFPRGICKLIENYPRCSLEDKRKVERNFSKILKHERRRKLFLKHLKAYSRKKRGKR